MDWDYLDEVDVIGKLPPNFNELRESKKWQERKEALEALVNLLSQNPRLCTKRNYGEIVDNLNFMLGKDANINVNALAAKSLTGLASGLRNKFGIYAGSVFPIIVEKLKEKKPLLKDPLVDCVDAVTSSIPNIENLLDDLVNGMQKPNPQIKQQLDLFIFRHLNKLTADKAPKKVLKGIAPFLAKHCADADADVREAAFSAWGAVSRLIGDASCRSLLGELANDESKLKKIAEMKDKAANEFSKLQSQLPAAAPAIAPQDNAPSVNNASAPRTVVAAQKAPVQEMDPFDMLDPVDVLSKLPDDFYTNLESKKWTERRDALQILLDLMVKDPKLDPKVSYGSIIDLVKKALEKDANINVQALAASCLTGIADGLRSKFAPNAVGVVPAILEKFKEKKITLREPLVKCIDAVTAHISLEQIQDDLVLYMGKPNPNIKIQTDLFLFRSFKRLNSQTMPKKTLKILAPLLVKHTGDSDPEVRDASYAALGAVMRAIGEKPCIALLGDIAEDSLKMNKIKEFYQKVCEEAGPEVVNQMVQSVHKSDVGPQSLPVKPATVKKLPSRPSSRNEDVGDECVDQEESLKPPPGSAPKKAEKSSKAVAPPKEESPPPSSSDAEPLLSVNEDKLKRIKDEKSLKILKWNFGDKGPQNDHIEQLQEQFGGCAKAALTSLLFSKDFKQHMKACEVLSQEAESCPESLVKNSDLIFKWCTLRFFETNPAVLIKALELCLTTARLIKSADEPMSTEEVNNFVPHLLLKTGESKDNMRATVREVVDELTEICGPFKLCSAIIDKLKTKNSRQRAECLQILDSYLSRAGTNQLKPLGIHKAIAECVSDRDNNVRNAAINAIVTCYREEGDLMWKSIGKMADKERQMVEERIKRSNAVPGSAKATNKVGPKIVVPSTPVSTVVRRPNSIGRGSRQSSPEREYMPDSGLNATVTKSSRPGPKRYAIDDDYVEMTGIHELPSSKLLNETMTFQPRHPSQVNYKPAVSTPLKRSGSSSSISSIDTMDQLERVIQNVSSSISDVAREALEQVTYMMTVPEQKALVLERLSMLLSAMAAQLNLVRKMYGVHSAKGHELLVLGLNFLNMLASKEQNHQALNVDEAAMSDFLYEVIHILPIVNLDENIKRSYNTLVVRITSRVETTVFIVAVLKCLGKDICNPDSEEYNLFIRCAYKWHDKISKNPQPLRIRSAVSALNEFYRNIADIDVVSKETVQTCEACIRTMLSIHGDAIIDAMRRESNPVPKLLSTMNVMLKHIRDRPDWQPILPGQVAPDLPQPRSSQQGEEALTPTRPIVHVLVDNVFRDFGSRDRHIAKIISHIEQTPSDSMVLDDYLRSPECAMPDLIKSYIKDFKVGNLPQFDDEDVQFMAQHMQMAFTFHSKISAEKKQNSNSNAYGFQRDINTASFSGELTVPSNLLVNKTLPTAEVKKKRRTIDPSVLSALQSRFSEI